MSYSLVHSNPFAVLYPQTPLTAPNSTQNSFHNQNSNLAISHPPHSPNPFDLEFPPLPNTHTNHTHTPASYYPENSKEFDAQIEEFLHQVTQYNEDWLKRHPQFSPHFDATSNAPTPSIYPLTTPDSPRQLISSTITHESNSPDSPSIPSHFHSQSITPHSQTRSNSPTPSNSSQISSRPSTPVIQSKHRSPFTVRPLMPITPIRPFFLSGSGQTSSQPSSPQIKSPKLFSAYPSTTASPYFTIRLIHATPQRIFTPLKEKKIEPPRTIPRTIPRINSIASLLTSPLNIESSTTKSLSIPHLSSIFSALGQLFTAFSTSIAVAG